MILAIFTVLVSRTGFAEDVSCLNGECHKSILLSNYQHPHVKQEDCMACHKEISAEHRDSSQVLGGKESLFNERYCLECHNNFGPETDQLHLPVTEGKCLGCHRIHGSDVQGLLKNPADELCRACHNHIGRSKDKVHGPVAVGSCSVCHDSHGTMKMLLRSRITDLCYDCHSGKKEEFSAYTYLHGPVAVDCVICHDPHAADLPALILQKPRELCGKCHPLVLEKKQNEHSRHEALNSEASCMKCHLSHGSMTKYNLKASEKNLCLSCHNKDKRSYNKTVLSIDTKLKRESRHHGPIDEGKCRDCHLPHASDYVKLLRYGFPQGIYNDFKQENYELCFMCHDAGIFQDELTVTATGFRDVERNLHYLHVNRPKGRSCMLCHDPHSSKNAHFIRDKGGFGEWDLPVNFEESSSGGACLPACHRKYSYSRSKDEKSEN